MGMYNGIVVLSALHCSDIGDKLRIEKEGGR